MTPVARRSRDGVWDDADVLERHVLVTFSRPEVGAVLNIGGERFRIVRVVSWTGTVADLEVEPLVDDPAE